jgi:hypothetical protein
MHAFLGRFAVGKVCGFSVTTLTAVAGGLRFSGRFIPIDKCTLTLR